MLTLTPRSLILVSCDDVSEELLDSSILTMLLFFEFPMLDLLGIAPSGKLAVFSNANRLASLDVLFKLTSASDICFDAIVDIRRALTFL